MNIKKRIDALREKAGWDEKEYNLLLKPKRISKAEIKIKNNSFPVWRVLFNDALGPGKGGVRFHPAVSKDEVVSLAFWMMIKNSLLGLPYGGAKGGVKFNPKTVSRSEIEEASRRFIDVFWRVLGEDKDIPAPDVYTDSQVMAWMLDEYEKKTGRHEPAMITGKPLDLQGCALRESATAKGAFIIIKHIIEKEFKGKEVLTFSIQGFGNVGSNFARMISSLGVRIISLSDSKGGIYDKNGIDVERAIKVKEKSGAVGSYEKAKKISNKGLLEAPVDFLVLAGIENQIRADNAKRIKAKYIIEIANGPVTYDAENILLEKGIIVMPDVLVNAGGVVVSYFEWSQNKAGNILEVSYLEELLKKKMVSSWEKVLKFSKENNITSLKNAAYLLAIERVLKAEKLRGRL